MGAFASYALLLCNAEEYAYLGLGATHIRKEFIYVLIFLENNSNRLQQIKQIIGRTVGATKIEPPLRKGRISRDAAPQRRSLLVQEGK
jgi:hypothetical protein